MTDQIKKARIDILEDVIYQLSKIPEIDMNNYRESDVYVLNRSIVDIDFYFREKLLQELKELKNECVEISCTNKVTDHETLCNQCYQRLQGEAEKKCEVKK